MRQKQALHYLNTVLSNISYIKDTYQCR